MNNVRKIIKVFIASPGDLVNERQIARDVAEEYNTNNSELTGYQIEMVGWEETIGGIGRPQEIINKDLARCELFVGMLWKRWGTPPDVDGEYSSGFEEEYSISFERYAKEKKPNMLMLFKNVDNSLLQDPGEGLKKVLEFKDSLIKEKKVLYEVFDDEREYEKKLRRWLTSYVNRLLEGERENFISESTDDSVKSTEVSDTQSDYSDSDTGAFLNKLYSSINGGLWKSLSTSDVAFFKLFGFSLYKSGNDNDCLGVHDSNLIYSNKDKYQFHFPLELSLVKSGLNWYNNKNTPLWRWLSLDSEQVHFYMNYFEEQIKARFIDVIAFISYKDSVIDKDVKSDWFRMNAPDEVRLSGIRYLAKLGGVDDIDLLMAEYEKRNSRTLNLALEAIVAINLRQSTLRGFESILEFQPTSLGNNILNFVRNGLESLDSPMLEKGLRCANAEVRLVCLDILIRRNYFDDDGIEDLFEHEDVKLRLNALLFLSKKNNVFYGDKASKILILNKDAMDKDKYYSEYLSSSMYFDSVENLNKKLSSEFLFNATVLVALAKKDKKKYLPIIRGYLSDFCESYYLENLKSLLSPGQSDVSYISKDIKNHIKNNMQSDCLEWLSSCMQKEDMPIIRRVVEKGDVLIRKPVLDYFKKYGEWGDVFLLDKAQYSTNQTLLMMYAGNDEIYEYLADVYLRIAKGRESDLIFSSINDSTKLRVIAKLSARAFSELSDSQISNLLNDGSLLIREKASLKIIESFSKSRIEKILSSVLSDATYYYNVVHWLDLGLSVKQSMYQPAVRLLLKE